jgi:hypothetical protein
MTKKLKFYGRYVRVEYLEVSEDQAQEAIETGIVQDVFQEDCDTIAGVVSGWIFVDDEEVGTLCLKSENCPNASVTRLSANSLVSEEHGKFESEEIIIDGDYDPSKLSLEMERIEFHNEMYEVYTVCYDENEIEFAWSDSKISEFRAILSDGSQQDVEFRDEDDEDDD